MAKKIIRLTEGDFINIINDSVRKIIKENFGIYDPHFQDLAQGLYENGTDTVHVNTEKTDVAHMEIVGMSGIIYDVDVTLEFHYNETPSSYYQEGSIDTYENVLDVNISYYDDYNQLQTVDYTKDIEFESALLDYIDVDYVDYDETNHYQSEDF